MWIKQSQQLRKKHENGDSDFFSPWIDIVKSWFCHLGMRDFWVDECSGFSVEYIKQAVKLRLSDTHKQQWSAEIAENSACTYYVRIKDEPCLEKYLIDLDFRNRCIVAKFRSRSNFCPLIIPNCRMLLKMILFVRFVMLFAQMNLTFC